MRKIALIIPYIGNFRKDFPFWLKSVEHNPSIDFLLFTNNHINNIPPNLHVYKTDFEELKVCFQKHFDFTICLTKPYKFCDFRPAYGEIFADYLTDYDFWGYTDTDIIYGDLRQFVTEEILDKYDHIFGRGHFSLYRNNKKVNSEYKNVEVPNYRQVFTYDEGRAFDEYCGTSKHWADNLYEKFYDSIIFDDIDCMYHPFFSHMRRREYYGCKNIIYSYENGKLYRIFERNGTINKIPTMYVHFQKRKMAVNTYPDNKFIMIPNSYEKYEEIKNINRLQYLGAGKSIYYQRYKLKLYEFRSKFYKFYLRIHPSPYGYPKLPEDISKYYIEDLD